MTMGLGRTNKNLLNLDAVSRKRISISKRDLSKDAANIKEESHSSHSLSETHSLSPRSIQLHPHTSR
jgi:hypothetical protein